ncbi:hypothetical protein HDU98_002918 [Podochytrium sp. JEL0797]|nr:hypothetical protein HDU98_002918 [Podochytrium sp. JEL0797]
MAGIASLMTYWIPTSVCPTWVWSLVYMVPVVGLNMFPVSGFGEVEFYLSMTKIIAVTLFLIISACVWFGAGTGTGPIWFKNWSPAVVGETPFNQFVNIAGAFTTAAFSYGGTELIGITAGEAANPRKSVPKAINGTIYRIFFFYLCSLFFVGVLLHSSDPVLRSKSIKTSPFVWVYNQVGINFAADAMNAVIIIAVTSAANSAIYACARTLMRLAEEGSAPKFLGKVDSRGVPMISVMVVAGFGLVAVGAAFAAGPNGAGLVFDFLSGVISYGIMAAWMMMSITHVRFRAGYVAQGYKIEDLPYVAPFFPYTQYLSITIGTFTAGCLLLSAFYSAGRADFYNLTWFMTNSWAYCGVPIVILLFLGHATFKSGFALVRLEDMDFETGKYIESAEDIAANLIAEEKGGVFKRIGKVFKK